MSAPPDDGRTVGAGSLAAGSVVLLLAMIIGFLLWPPGHAPHGLQPPEIDADPIGEGTRPSSIPVRPIAPTSFDETTTEPNDAFLGTARGDILRQHIAGTQARLDHAAWVMRAQELARQHGLDRASATFRLLQPAADFEAAEFRLESFPSSTLRYNFIEVGRAYTDITYVSVGGFERGVKTSPVSLQELFPKTYLSRARAVSVPGTSNYNVEILFSQSGVEGLAALLGTSDPTNSFVDWYAAGHLAGEPVTAMRAVVTSQNVALVPFSVNEVVRQGLVDQPILIAKDLTQEAATKLVRFLGF
jgi:hypothetical protein